MVISKKRDFRTRKKRETFFGLPFFPLIIFLILVIFLLLVSIPKVSREKELISEVSKEKFKKTTEIPITGEVISGLNLTKINYNTNEPLQGNFNLRFYVGDLIPVTSNVSFKISGIKCNYFYVCGDGQTLAPWEFYNITAGRCQNVSGYWQNNPWHDFCGENYNVYPNANSAINCTSLGGKCCEPGNGIGYFYPNLNCSNKECWDDCATKQIIDLKTFVSRSTTPTKGNFSYGQANNVNGSEPNVASFGFSYCSNTSEGSVGNVGGIFGRLGGVASGTGYIIRGQPAQPDLTVARIEIQESTPPIGTTGAIKKIYARIRNSGMGTASNFVVRAEWNSIPYMPIIGNYKEETVSYLGPGQEYSFYVNDLNAIENLELTVTADYYNSVSESNEGNNEKKTFLGCLDTDGGNNKEEKGKCYDFSEQYYYEDYCE
ncbi:MAG: hypothetical protein N3G19_02125, partial [Candidatus Pacearchaeota archaeon]|nr:hypothetical protein [Candidatus Pacearchaeota archaeon]